MRDPEPIKLEAPEEMITKLKELGIENILIIGFPTVIGPVLKVYMSETPFTKKILESPKILGEISILAKYAIFAKMREGPLVLLRGLRYDGTYCLVIFEISKREGPEKILRQFVQEVIKNKDSSPITLLEILQNLLKSIE